MGARVAQQVAFLTVANLQLTVLTNVGLLLI